MSGVSIVSAVSAAEKEKEKEIFASRLINSRGVGKTSLCYVRGKKSNKWSNESTNQVLLDFISITLF